MIKTKNSYITPRFAYTVIIRHPFHWMMSHYAWLSGSMSDKIKRPTIADLGRVLSGYDK